MKFRCGVKEIYVGLKSIIQKGWGNLKSGLALRIFGVGKSWYEMCGARSRLKSATKITPLHVPGEILVCKGAYVSKEADET